MVCGHDELQRTPYGVEIRSACGAAGWVSLGLSWGEGSGSHFLPEGWRAGYNGCNRGRKGDHGVKMALRLKGDMTQTTHSPNLELGHGNVFSGLHWGPCDRDQKLKRDVFGSSSFSHSPRASLLRLQSRHYLICISIFACQHQCLYIYRSRCIDVPRHFFRQEVTNAWKQMSMNFSQSYLEFVLT